MIKEWFLKKPARIRRVLNFWPPFFFTGIKVMTIADDYRYCKVKLKNWPGTRNVNGTQFGGSLFAMTDPLYGMLFMGVLGTRYYIWDKAAQIDFIKPGVGEVYVECEIPDALLKEVLENTKDGQKYFPVVKNIIYDKNRNIVAIITRTLYIRLRPPFRPNAPSYGETKEITVQDELESGELAKSGADQMRADEKRRNEGGRTDMSDEAAGIDTAEAEGAEADKKAEDKPGEAKPGAEEKSKSEAGAETEAKTEAKSDAEKKPEAEDKSEAGEKAEAEADSGEAAKSDAGSASESREADEDSKKS